MSQIQEAVAAGVEASLLHEHDVAVAVITPAGVYPGEDQFQRIPSHEKIEVVLAAAARALELTNTSDWVVKAHDRKLHPHQTFHEEHLHGIVNIEWHKSEGGGGARSFVSSEV
jgi:formaldehyde-activating enzyme involved in methanogenesis